MFRSSKRGVSLTEAPSVVVFLMVIAVVLGITGTILTNFVEQNCDVAGTIWNATTERCVATDGSGHVANGSAAYNATLDGLSGVTTFSGFQTTIAIIVVAAVILGLIGTALFVSRMMG